MDHWCHHRQFQTGTPEIAPWLSWASSSKSKPDSFLDYSTRSAKYETDFCDPQLDHCIAPESISAMNLISHNPTIHSAQVSDSHQCRTRPKMGQDQSSGSTLDSRTHRYCPLGFIGHTHGYSRGIIEDGKQSMTWTNRPQASIHQMTKIPNNEQRIVISPLQSPNPSMCSTRNFPTRKILDLKKKLSQNPTLGFQPHHRNSLFAVR